jgi:hypothetical protein
MSRGLSATWTSALSSNQFRLATLVSIEFSPSDILRLTDYGVDLSYSGDTYGNSANLIDIGDVTETGALKVNEMTIALTGSDPNALYVSAFLNNNHVNCRMLIYRALIDANDAVLDVFTFFDGRISNFEIADSATESAISITAASHWADFEKVRCRRTNLNSQQSFFPSDVGMEYAHIVTKDLRWGRES